MSALLLGLQASSYLKPGLSSWEFFTTLGYEWSIIQGRRSYRWTIWVCSEVVLPYVLHRPPRGLVLILPAKIYSLARLATLACVILTLIGLDSTRPINCQVSFAFLIYLLS